MQRIFVYLLIALLVPILTSFTREIIGDSVWKHIFALLLAVVSYYCIVKAENKFQRLYFLVRLPVFIELIGLMYFSNNLPKNIHDNAFFIIFGTIILGIILDTIIGIIEKKENNKTKI